MNTALPLAWIVKVMLEKGDLNIAVTLRYLRAAHWEMNTKLLWLAIESITEVPWKQAQFTVTAIETVFITALAL